MKASLGMAGVFVVIFVLGMIFLTTDWVSCVETVGFKVMGP